jgi:alkanesulfonate monooxygenase SsuD/methylene tetrahydromethanopterin reductase-like flavin-dependent oxidoreductase (luciferase family)
MQVDMPRTGIAFSGGPTPAEIVDCVKLAEQLGYDSAWVAEGHGGDQFAVLAACATQTSRILLGTSITSVFVRTAPTIAMAAATLDDLTAGRFILGVGSSHKVQVEAEHGMAYGKPLTRVRETIEVIRRLLKAGRVSYQVKPSASSFDLWFSPRHRTVRCASAVSQMTALCGRPDGIIGANTLAPPRSSKQLAEGRGERAGPGPDHGHHPLAGIVAGPPEARRPGLAFYAGFFPRYNRMMAEYGFVEEAAAIAAAWSRGDREAAERAVSDELIDATSVAGTPAQCRERVEAYRRSGIDVPILSPFARGPGAKAKFEALIRACAP